MNNHINRWDYLQFMPEFRVQSSEFRVSGFGVKVMKFVVSGSTRKNNSSSLKTLNLSADRQALNFELRFPAATAFTELKKMNLVAPVCKKNSKILRVIPIM